MIVTFSAQATANIIEIKQKVKNLHMYPSINIDPLEEFKKWRQGESCNNIWGKA